ncbi:MAG: DNA internalization-related competence protein ComEC/Rec2 [Gammaproteobacteria bacterium]|nr:DNA internalization-related competence protein ComEC/Rec2 [Gammaproteobacteria bacterium]
MIRACLLMIAGGYAAQLSRLPLSSDLCKLLLVASILAVAGRRSRYPAFLCLGFALFMQSGQEIVDGRLEVRLANDSMLTQVRIVDFPKTTGSAVVMLVAPLDDHRIPARTRVSWYEPPLEPAIGDVWQFELRLRRPRGLSNPGVFDVEAWLFRQKIQATGYVVNGKRNRRLQTDSESAIDSYRREFLARADRAAGSADAAAVLAAVGVGARHRISRTQWHDYAVTGTSHLMAISGLHIGLAATVAFVFARTLLGLLRITRSAQVLAIVVGVVVAAAYAGVSGLGVPAQRASLMLLVAACAIARRRNIDPFAAIAVAALGIFILDPVSTMTPGFNLSFAAVVVLLWLARIRKNVVATGRFLRRAGKTVQQLFTMQVFLLFGLMPLTVILFHRIAFLALPVNLVAVPLFSIVTVPFTLAGLAVGGSDGMFGQGALRVAATSVEWLLALIERAARLPFADTTVAEIQGFGWLVVFMPSLLILLPRRWPGRRLALLGVVALLLQSPAPPGKGCVDVHVLDVGQGLATVLQTERSTVMFDTGASYRDGGAVAEHVIVPFLKSKRITRIDRLIVSHADIDHSGGVRAIREYAQIGMLIVGESLRETNLAASTCAAGQGWQADGVSFRMLHPDPVATREGNDSSCVLLLETGPHALLLTGDIEAAAEREIIARAGLSAVDVVVVPHHGSLTSSTEAFVDAVSPQLAIVSAGFGNRWGFPKEQVLLRWQAVGAEVLGTATAGAVSLRLCRAGGLQALRSDRYERRRFWRESTD